ncbi:MAG TPA: hypothetical protein VI387_04295 [Candidatus Brocadiales bacterium]|nr:hypothetical protein [Candidatus Brocadiales bacterium]
MVNDIRPEASVLLRQIANISQKRESGVRSLEPGVRNLDSRLKTQQLTHIKTISAKGGVSVVEEVFNQIYSKSGFLKEDDVVPVKREQLGTQLDVYA